MALKRGIEKAILAVNGSVTRRQPHSGRARQTEQAGDREELIASGTISANNDETIGHIIAEAMKKVGKDGVITWKKPRP